MPKTTYIATFPNGNKITVTTSKRAPSHGWTVTAKDGNIVAKGWTTLGPTTAINKAYRHRAILMLNIRGKVEDFDITAVPAVPVEQPTPSPARSVPPLKIAIMLVCHYMGDPTTPGWESPAGRQFRAELVDEGMIDTDHRTTPRGREWIKAICSTPQPAR